MARAELAADVGIGSRADGAVTLGRETQLPAWVVPNASCRRPAGSANGGHGDCPTGGKAVGYRSLPQMAPVGTNGAYRMLRQPPR